MTCNGCQALRGQYATNTSVLAVTPADGITAMEVCRVTVPPSADPLKLVGIVNVAAAATATQADVFAIIARGLFNLGAVDYDYRYDVPFTDVQPQGIRITLTEWITTPGDYILGVGRASGSPAANVVANIINKSRLWWER